MLAAGGQVSNNANSESDQAKAFAKATVQQYVVRDRESQNAELAVSPEPVFRWSNLLGRRFYGDVYVWTRRGRPEVIATITSVFGARRKFETEMHSLSTGRPTLTENDALIWSPTSPGVVLKPIPDAAAPGESSVKRLRQMRSLAARFAVTAEYNQNVWQLRLLPSPIFRYQSDDSEVKDGALFAFVKGTDPDAILVIESRENIRGQRQWQYAIARFNGNCLLTGKLDGVEVWRVEKADQLNDPTQPYFSKRGTLTSPVAE